MAERQPGCLCFFPRKQKGGKFIVAAPVTVEAAPCVTAEIGQRAAAPHTEGGLQPRVAVRISAASEPGSAGPVGPFPATGADAPLPAAPAAFTDGNSQDASEMQPVLTDSSGSLPAPNYLCEPQRPLAAGLLAAEAKSNSGPASAAAGSAAVETAPGAEAPGAIDLDAGVLADAAAADAAATVSVPAAAAAADTPGERGPANVADAATAPDSLNAVAATDAVAAAAPAQSASMAFRVTDMLATDAVSTRTESDQTTAAMAEDVGVAATSAADEDAAAGADAGAVAAAGASCAPASLLPEQVEQAAEAEACLLSRSGSFGSSVYFSAGGWSQFGDDGEWLGGAAAVLQFFHSVNEDCPLDAEAAAAAAVSRAATAESAAGGAAPAGPQTLLTEALAAPAASPNADCGRPADNTQEQQRRRQSDVQPHHLRSGAPPLFPAGPPAASTAAVPSRDSSPPASSSPPQLLLLPLPATSTRPQTACAPAPAPPITALQAPSESGDGAKAPPPPQQPQTLAGASARGSDAGSAASWVNGVVCAADPSPPPQEQPQGGGSTAAAAASVAAVTASAAADFGAAATAAAAAVSDSREAVLDQVADLYGVQGRPCKACQVLLQYCKAQGVAPDSVAAELLARGLPDAATLTKLVQGVTESLADLATDEGWQMVRNDELQLLYRSLPGGVHAFRARCVLDYPLEEPLSLAREVDLCPTWNKYCTSAAVLREMSITDVVVYMSLWVPWPFNNVGFLLEANGSDLYDEEGRLLICFSTPSSKGTPSADASATAASHPPPPPGSEKHSRVRLLAPSCLSFRPVPPSPKSPGRGRGSGAVGAPHPHPQHRQPPHRTACEVQVYVDPGVRHVPPFVISFVLKVLSPFVHGAVKRVLATAFKSPANPLPQRIQKRPELYGMVRRRTEAYLRSQAAGAAGAPAAPGLAAADRGEGTAAARAGRGRG